MRGTKTILAVLVLAVIVGMTSIAGAQGVKVSIVGSSAMFTGTEVAAFTDVCSARAGSDCHHWSMNGKAPSGNNFAQGVDSRSASIKPEGGSLWVVWDNATSPASIWTYLNVDSVVGNRLFFATPRATLQIDSAATSTAGKNLIPASILVNKQTNLTQADEAALPGPILAAAQVAFTTGASDIRPEDAKFNTTRILAPYNAANLNGLGYGVPAASCPGATSLIGCPILGSFGGGASNPVQFALSGSKDPITLLKVPPTVTIPVGAAPIIFVYNNTGPGLSGGGFKNITFTTAGNVFNGTKGLASDIGGSGANPLTVILREPLSGTMNTTEWNTFRVFLAPKFPAAKNSQEKGIDLTQPNTNPLNLPSADGGVRVRGIGTGQVISGNAGVGGILHIADSVGYTFFSFGNVAPIAGGGGVGRYVTLDGVDPIATAYSGGVLPTCAAPCPVAPGTSFPHLRDGSYRTWSLLRFMTDKTGPNFTNTQALVTAVQNEVNKTVPDFVPAAATADGDPGMPYLKSHFSLGGASKGKPTNIPENGGDVGGCPFRIGGPNQTQVQVRLNGAKALANNVPWPGGSCDLTPGHN